MWASPRSEPSLKLSFELAPSMAPVPRTRNVFPCGPLTAIERRTRAAPASSDFVAAAATGSSESALLVPPPPQPAATTAAAAAASAAATAALRPSSIALSVVPSRDAERVISGGRRMGAAAMAVAAAPCEERDGCQEDLVAAPLSVLPLLLAAARFGL